MTNTHNKTLVWEYWQTMNGNAGHQLEASLHPEVVWHGFQPFRNLSGSAEVGAKFWQPLLTAIPDLTRRPYLFIGGQFEGGDWVCGTGDFVGTFSSDWHHGAFSVR